MAHLAAYRIAQVVQQIVAHEHPPLTACGQGMTTAALQAKALQHQLQVGSVADPQHSCQQLSPVNSCFSVDPKFLGHCPGLWLVPFQRVFGSRMNMIKQRQHERARAGCVPAAPPQCQCLHGEGSGHASSPNLKCAKHVSSVPAVHDVNVVNYFCKPAREHFACACRRRVRKALKQS